MANQAVKQKIYDVLKNNLFNKFDGKRLKEKNQMIWNQFMEHLAAEEWGKITLSIAASPEEIKAS